MSTGKLAEPQGNMTFGDLDRMEKRLMKDFEALFEVKDAYNFGGVRADIVNAVVNIERLKSEISKKSNAQ